MHTAVNVLHASGTVPESMISSQSRQCLPCNAVVSAPEIFTVPVLCVPWYDLTEINSNVRGTVARSE